MATDYRHTSQRRQTLQLQTLLTPAINEDQWSISRSDRCTPSDTTRNIHFTGRQVGPRADLDAAASRKFPSLAGNWTQLVQSHTGSAIPAPIQNNENGISGFQAALCPRERTSFVGGGWEIQSLRDVCGCQRILYPITGRSLSTNYTPIPTEFQPIQVKIKEGPYWLSITLLQIPLASRSW
jgi:hypothetical protein